MKKYLLKAIRHFLEKSGFEVFPRLPDHHYVLKYYGRSAIKQPDIRSIPIFAELAAKVIHDKHTYLYYDRLFTIYQILKGLESNDETKPHINTAELGVYRGGGSYFICGLSEKLGLNISHYCFDTFEGHSAEDVIKSLEPKQEPGSFHKTSYEVVNEYLQEFPSVSIYKGRFQETCNNLDDMSFGFVHLDMDIYSPTIFALNYFEKKMVKGGVILLDDYGFLSCPGIEKAVSEFVAHNKSKYFGFPLLSGQYILLRL